jgi:hypothetical protein
VPAWLVPVLGVAAADLLYRVEVEMSHCYPVSPDIAVDGHEAKGMTAGL